MESASGVGVAILGGKEEEKHQRRQAIIMIMMAELAIATRSTEFHQQQQRKKDFHCLALAICFAYIGSHLYPPINLFDNYNL